MNKHEQYINSNTGIGLHTFREGKDIGISRNNIIIYYSYLHDQDFKVAENLCINRKHKCYA